MRYLWLKTQIKLNIDFMVSQLSWKKNPEFGISRCMEIVMNNSLTLFCDKFSFVTRAHQDFLSYFIVVGENVTCVMNFELTKIHVRKRKKNKSISEKAFVQRYGLPVVVIVVIKPELLV